jgi:hypothetical protein
MQMRNNIGNSNNNKQILSNYWVWQNVVRKL